LKSLLQGVLARGTARSIATLSPYVAGKTGTTDEENDAWFLGFTNDVTVAVWLGYDNGDGQRRTLGSGSTGDAVAVPVFESIIQAAWANVAPKGQIAPPSQEARQQLSCKSTDIESEGRRRRGGESLSDCFRLDEHGRVLDTRRRLVSRESRREDRDESAMRQRVEPAEKSERAKVFESTSPWQTVPQQAVPQWGSTLDNRRRGQAPRDWQGQRLDSPNYYWLRE